MQKKSFVNRLGACVATIALGAGMLVGGFVSPATAVTGDPTVGVTPAGTTSVPVTQGKARGSGLWGYVGDVETRSSGSVFSYGVDVDADGSLWVTDSAKVVYTTSAFVCGLSGGVLTGGECYVGKSRVHKYELTGTDWAAGQYQGNGAFAAAAAGTNDGVGANYQALSAAMVLDGGTMTNGRFGGARGIAVDDTGKAWVADSDAVINSVTNTKKGLRVIGADGTDAGAYGDLGGWPNRYGPYNFDYMVGLAKLGTGNIVTTQQTPELLKEYRNDGTFVRNIYLNQPAGSAYPGDPGYRSPYAIADDPTTPANDVLVGYIDPGTGNPSLIERIDIGNCRTEPIGNPAGSFRDICPVIDTIGVGNLVKGGSTSVTFAIQVDPLTGDIYVGQRDNQLQVFKTNGDPIGATTALNAFPKYGAGTQNGQVKTVRGITFDARGYLYATVSEGTASTRVEIFARTPDPVTGLSAAHPAGDNTTANLAWNALPVGSTAEAKTNLRDYVVEQSVDGGATWSVVNTPTGTGNTATITGLDPASTYVFRVSAWNEAGNGDWVAAAPLIPLADDPATITVVKTGDGVETASAADAVSVAADSDVAFEYTVTNEGPGAITGVALNDSVLGAIAAPVGFDGTLAEGASVTFTATGPVAAGAYQNTATVTGQSVGETVTGSDDWFGFGVTTGITVTKTGNGSAAHSAGDAIEVPAGANVVFNYAVTNDGNVPVTDLSLTDSVLGAVSQVASPAGFDGTLAPGATVIFTATGPVAAGSYSNEIDATGLANGEPVTASDDWFGFGVLTAVSVIKSGNGVANDSADSQLYVPADTVVSFAYEVTNGGNTDLEVGSIVDSVLGDIAFPAGFTGIIPANDSVVFTASGPVAAGAYSNSVVVKSPGPASVDLATDDWFGFGTVDGLTLVKAGAGVTNSSADDAHMLPAGTLVDFTYTVTNSGNAPVVLSGVSDDRIGAATAPAGFSGTLAPQESAVFTASGAVAAGSYTNVASAAGASATGVTLSAQDDWFGFGVLSGLSIKKAGNGAYAPDVDAPFHVAAGSAVGFSYEVTNSGNTAVEIGGVADSVLGAIAAPVGFDGMLGAGQSITFAATGVVPAGAYRNDVTVTGTEVSLQEVLTAADSWNGFGDKAIDPVGPVDPAVPAVPGDSPTLSSTGQSSATPGIAVAALILLAGLALVVLARRRRTEQ